MAFYKNDYNINLKEFLDIFIKSEIYRKLEIKNIHNNIFFKEKGTDILAITTKDNVDDLKNQGYEETTYDNYISEFINASIKDEETTNYIIQNISKEFTYQNKRYGISYEGNIINIVSYEPYELIYSLKYDFEIIDSFIDNEGFFYIAGNNHIIKTHLMMDFYVEYNHDCITYFNDIESIYKVPTNNLEKILSIDDCNIYYLSNGIVRHITLGKKYYFYKDGQIFFNIYGKTDKVTIQVEHLHLYDWISLLGLNNYRINSEKISTKYLDDFKNILRFPFGSSLNGLLNYCDFSIKKDYKVDLDINGIQILGNFNYNYEKGLYKIKLRLHRTENTPVYFQADLIKDNICLKRVNGNSVDNIIYFCNLKLIFYKEFYNDELIEFDINVTDDYSAKLINTYEQLKDITIQDFDWISKIDQVFRKDSNKHQLVEVDYSNGYFIIRNYIKDSKERAFNKDFGIRLVEKDGSPSLLWRQLKDRDYFLKLKNYLVVKKIKPKRKERSLFSITRKTFKLNLDKITNNTLRI